MTTIACDGRTMAGDGQMQTYGTICSRITAKVVRLADGSLYGACGEHGDGERHRAWIEAGANGDAPKLSDDFGFMILRSDGLLLQGGRDGIGAPIEAPFAIGSGMDIAIGAMDAGASAHRAIEIASRRNPHTGGEITELHLIAEVRDAA